MAGQHLEVIDSTVPKTHEWLGAIANFTSQQSVWPAPQATAKPSTPPPKNPPVIAPPQG